MDDPLTLETFAHTGTDQHVTAALLEQAGPHPRLAVLAVTRLQHHRLDALQLEQPCERQPGRAGADDRDLCALRRRHRAHRVTTAAR